MSGKFIVFEGIDNSGKTTVATKISEILQKRRIKSILTRHPGSTEVGMEIRRLLKHSPYPINANAQALLFAADNSMFMNQILKPNLEEGKWVIGDRNNFISSMAYQIASGCEWDELDKVHTATKQTAKIDLLLIFRCTWEESRRRKALQKDDKPDRFEDAGREYFDKLADCYDQILSTQSDRLHKFVKMDSNGLINARYVDATQSLDSVVEDVLNHLEKLLLQSTL